MRLEDEEKAIDTQKLLFLGCGESGKSTLAKQMRLLNGVNFTSDEIAAMRVSILDFVVNLAILFAQSYFAYKELGCPDGAVGATVKAETAAKEVIHLGIRSGLNPELADQIALLWTDPEMKKFYTCCKARYQLPDSLKYFFDQIHTLSKLTWMPNDEDMIRVRIRTTGVIEYEFKLDETVFKLMDVGGQKSERKKMDVSVWRRDCCPVCSRHF